jgi:hypothetical protein
VSVPDIAAQRFRDGVRGFTSSRGGTRESAEYHRHDARVDVRESGLTSGCEG